MGVTLSGIVFDESNKEKVNNAWVYLLDNNKLVIDSTKVNDKAEYMFTINDPSKEYFVGAKERVKYYDRLIPVGKLVVGDNKKDIGLFPKYKLIDQIVDAKTNTPVEGVKTTFIDKATGELLQILLKVKNLETSCSSQSSMKKKVISLLRNNTTSY
jgi:hypothetical protein